MTNAVYSTLSRPRAGLITNGIGGDIIFSNERPQDRRQAIVEQLRAEESA